MNKYKEVTQYLINYYDKSADLTLDELLQGATDQQILEFETKLQVHLSNDYRNFLKQFGTLWFETLLIAGIVSSNPDDKEDSANALWLTLSEREQYNLPTKYVLLSDSEMGEWYALDTTNGRVELIDNVDFQVVPGEPDESYDSFSDFLYKKVKQYDEME